MNQVSALIVGCLGAILATLSPLPSHAAQTTQPLMLESRIPLEGVSGRIDHMAVDLKRGRLLIAELGNGTVDVVGLSAGRVMHRIGGLKEPQGVGYAMRGDLVAVADAGDGSVRIFRGDDLTPMGSLSLGDDADNVRIDPRNGMIVVGYGRGGLAMIDPERRTPVGQVPLAAHPESFQIDPGSGRAFVNLPDVRQIAVVDLNSLRVLDTWKLKQARANFPMALDPGRGVIAIVFRNPPTLVLLDRESGAERAYATTCGDADDVFFDGKRSRIYISCGSGELATFEWNGRGLRSLPTVATSPGARTSLFVPDLDRLFVARRAGVMGPDAAILVYRPVP